MYHKCESSFVNAVQVPISSNVYKHAPAVILKNVLHDAQKLVLNSTHITNTNADYVLSIKSHQPARMWFAMTPTNVGTEAPKKELQNKTTISFMPFN